RAIALARDGQLEHALALLEEIRRRSPGFAPAAHDSVVVLGWAGKHAEALRVYESLKPPVPTYVVGAAARNARDLRDYDRALALYREATGREHGTRGGDPTPFVAGEVQTLADADTGDVAINRADADLKLRKQTIEVMEAAAYAEERAGRPFDALRRTNAVLRIDPERRESLRRRVFLLSAVGAPEQALEHAIAHRKHFSDKEFRGIEGDAAAAMVRRGPLPAASEAQRFEAVDIAIARLDELIARWRTQGPEAAPDIRRARLDRMIALRDRVRMAEVIAEYEAFGSEALPAHIRRTAASAYLHQRRPVAARDLYRSVLREEPDDFEAARGLIYALVETEHFREAQEIADALDEREGPWLWLKGAVDPEPNARKLVTETLAASLRLYADRLGEAQERFERMTSIAPNNSRLRAGLAGTQLARGWPRRAGEEAELGLAQDPEARDLAVARATASLRRRDWRSADTQQAELGERFPEDTNVQKLQRDWQISQMAELRIVAGVSTSRANGTSATSSRGVSVESTLFAPPIDYAWRPFATGRLARAHVTEGTIILRQIGAGLEWRRRDYEASVQGGIAEFGRTRGTMRGALGWSPSDTWSFAAYGELFAADTPLRALRNNITANAAGGSATWRRDESAMIRSTVQAMDFSDGNLRFDGSVRGVHRLYTSPHFWIDGGLGIGATTNSDPGGPYFAPRSAAYATPEVSVQHLLMRHYERSWTHKLTVAPGAFWQQDHGTSFTPEIRYEHRIKPMDTLEIGLIGRFHRPVYDGNPEHVWGGAVEINWKF
ncbi:MAG: poly-beta-1,6 N-acetyl-D-glucosamine export porin PgaA, partial [Alphaproteobacteria bacterium]|nr:poly-beta-1,6 N-acetyl-D-glucosamine export porin PgaA [Alphaproteobacteria bacterium]